MVLCPLAVELDSSFLTIYMSSKLAPHQGREVIPTNPARMARRDLGSRHVFREVVYSTAKRLASPMSVPASVPKASEICEMVTRRSEVTPLSML